MFGPARAGSTSGKRLHDGRGLARRPTGRQRTSSATTRRRARAASSSPPRALVPAPGREAARDRRLRVVQGRHAAPALHEHEEGLAPEHARRLLGARPRQRQAPQARRRGGAESSLMFAKFSPDGDARRLRPRQRPLRRGPRRRAGHAPDRRRLGHDRQRDLRLGVRGGVRPARRLPLEPRRQAHRLLALRHERRRATSRSINDTDTLYPVVTQIPYPKVGTTNSAVRIGVVDRRAAATPAGCLALPGDPRDTYVAADGVGRRDRRSSSLQQLNRLQNTNDVWLARRGDRRRDARCFRDEDEAWVDVVDAWRWLPGGKRAALGQRARRLAPRLGGAARRRRRARLLTPGEFDVARGRGRGREGAGGSTSSRRPDDATRRYLYRARARRHGRRRARDARRTQPGTHAYDISPDGALGGPHLLDARTGRRSPTSCRLPEHKSVRVLEANAALAAAVAAADGSRRSSSSRSTSATASRWTAG